MMRDLRLLNTLTSLVIVYTALNLPFVVWMMRGFFRELPRELEEAAMVDGDSRLGALVRVILPLVTPGLAATAVFCLIVSWNEFLLALVLTQTDASMTLPVGIAGRVTQYEIKWGVMSAAGVVAMIPILVFAMAVQRYLVRGCRSARLRVKVVWVSGFWFAFWFLMAFKHHASQTTNQKPQTRNHKPQTLHASYFLLWM
jgi:ABC-type glycerol-3-phosphate transport system permease component